MKDLIMSFTTITLQEMKDFLENFASEHPGKWYEISLPDTKEVVFAKVVRIQGLKLSLRIYTSITGEVSRNKGEDAIRVVLAWKDEKDPTRTPRIVGKSKRVHRMENWRKHLTSRLEQWESLAPPPCPSCQSPMVERKGKNSRFYGCICYPHCKGTRSISSCNKDMVKV